MSRSAPHPEKSACYLLAMNSPLSRKTPSGGNTMADVNWLTCTLTEKDLNDIGCCKCHYLRTSLLKFVLNKQYFRK